MKLIIVDLPESDPVKNMATESLIYNSPRTEALTSESFIIRFWRNSSCVITGKFQKKEYEIDEKIVESEAVPVIKRFSGGGTVYHDEGTLNITLVKSRSHTFFSEQLTMEASWISGLVAETLNSFTPPDSAPFEVNSRSNIFHGERKIGGIAMALKKNIFLYHISILVDTDISLLDRVLTGVYPEEGRRYTASVRKPVVNLTNLVKEDPEWLIAELKSRFIRIFSEKTDISGKNITIYSPETLIKII